VGKLTPPGCGVAAIGGMWLWRLPVPRPVLKACEDMITSFDEKFNVASM